MVNTQPLPGKFFAFLAVVAGGLLLLSGLAAVVGYLGLPTVPGQDLLGPRLGQMAGMFLGLGCGALAIYHGAMSILSRPSRPLRLPPAYFFWIAFAVVLGLGNALLIFDVAARYLFPPLFLLGAALPTLAVAAWAARRLGWPITWRQASLAMAAGSTLSIFVAIVLEAVLGFVAYLLIAPLESLSYGSGDLFGGGDFLSRLFFSPFIIVFLVGTALAAPIPEELAKAVPLAMFGRRRIADERLALMVGMAGGAGFAILENMLYEGLYAQYSGWSWGGVTLLRGLGAVLHPLCSGIVALGWFRMRQGGAGRLLRAYALAVGLHTLWNGGFQAFVYLTGVDYYGGLGASLSLYGTAVAVLLVGYLAGLSLALWWLLHSVVTGLARDAGARVEAGPVERRTPSQLVAGWAFACAVVVVPIGAALGGSWDQIAAVVAEGPAPTTTPVPTQAPAACPDPSEPRLILFDHFEAAANDWPAGQSEGQKGIVDREIAGGVYGWNVEARQNAHWFSRPSMDPVADFYLAVDARQTSGPNDATHGVVFRESEAQSLYYFAIDNRGRYTFSVQDQGDWFLLIRPTPSLAIRHGVNRLAVRAEGSQFSLLINDVAVTQIGNLRLSAGRAGVAAELARAGDKAAFEFDNFMLCAP